MSEFDDQLRTAMHAVGNHAQVADLLDRSLRTSRVLRRRRAVAAVTTAAVVVGGIGVGGWALSIRPSGDNVVQVITTPSSASPTHSAVASAVPSFAPKPATSIAPTPAALAASPTPDFAPSEVATFSPSAGSVMLPSVECPTTFGIDKPGPPRPLSLLPEIPESTTSLASYTDKLHFVVVAAPVGWNCHAIDAADGNASVLVTPPGTSPTTFSQPFIRDTREGVGAYIASRGTGSVPDLLCAVMPDVIDPHWSGRPCPSRPAAELVLRDNPVAAEFYDPPGIVGDGAPSGGSYRAMGRVIDLPAPGSTSDGAASVTCTLPQPDAGVCDVIIVSFAPYGTFYPIPGG